MEGPRSRGGILELFPFVPAPESAPAVVRTLRRFPSMDHDPSHIVLAAVTSLLVACGSGTSSDVADAGDAAADGAAPTRTGSGAPLKPESYNLDCQRAADCIAVDTDLCCGGCGSFAIAKTDQARFFADRAAASSGACTGRACPDIDCAQTAAICEAGKCRLVQCSRTCPSDEPSDGGAD